jgi:predicted aminopeptidase
VTPEVRNHSSRAEAGQAAAERRAADDRATLDRLRAEIQQLRADHC